MYMKTSLRPQLSAQQSARHAKASAEGLSASCIDAMAAFLPVSLLMWLLIIFAVRELLVLALH